jgi:hypothetical protein
MRAYWTLVLRPDPDAHISTRRRREKLAEYLK